MEEYVYKKYSTDSEKEHLFNTYGSEISRIHDIAFDRTNTEKSYTIDELNKAFQGTVFACFDKSDVTGLEKIIGICCVYSVRCYKSDSICEKYDTLRYLEYVDFDNFYDCSYLYVDGPRILSIYDKNTEKMFNMYSIDMQYVISTLCKDKNYKNIGKYLLKYISDDYKFRGIKDIYICIESEHHRSSLLEMQYISNDESTTNIYLKKYQEAQKALCSYYQKIGCILESDLYYADRFITTDIGIHPLVFYNMYRINID
jgi:hypothetical protein